MHLAERGVPHHRRAHQFMYDVLDLTHCSACGTGMVTKHSHDCYAHYEDEDWDMTWLWRIEPADMAQVLELARACPAPLKPGCECPVHRGIGGEKGGRDLPHTARVTRASADVELLRVRVQLVEGMPGWAN